jgi:DNA-binding NtrC family response regulator
MCTEIAIKERNEALTKPSLRKSILVVDPDRKHREILSVILEMEGYLVTACDNMPTALDVFEIKSFDFVITDHSGRDRGSDGLSLLEAIKERKTDTPVLIISSQYEVEPYIAAMNLGALDYLSKPVNCGEVRRLVRTHCH